MEKAMSAMGLLPPIEIVKRSEALSQELKWYFTGKPCKNGHIAKRKTVNGHCCDCDGDYRKHKGKYFTGKPCVNGHLSERYQSGSCVACGNAKAEKYRREKPEAVRATHQRYLERLKAAPLLYEIIIGTKDERRRVQKAGRPRPIQCDVCRRRGKIQWDHNHATGLFRGWLCSKCNRTLGLVNDDPKILIALANYLKSPKA
jgi:hypothetical protein